MASASVISGTCEIGIHIPHLLKGAGSYEYAAELIDRKLGVYRIRDMGRSGPYRHIKHRLKMLFIIIAYLVPGKGSAHESAHGQGYDKEAKLKPLCKISAKQYQYGDAESQRCSADKHIGVQKRPVYKAYALHITAPYGYIKARHPVLPYIQHLTIQREGIDIAYELRLLTFPEYRNLYPRRYGGSCSKLQLQLIDIHGLKAELKPEFIPVKAPFCHMIIKDHLPLWQCPAGDMGQIIK